MARKLNDSERRDFEAALLLTEGWDQNSEWNALLQRVVQEREPAAMPQDVTCLIVDGGFKRPLE